MDAKIIRNFNKNLNKMVTQNKPLFDFVFDKLSDNHKFMKEIWKIVQSRYRDVGKGILVIYIPNMELFFKSQNLNLETEYIEQKLLSFYDQQVLNLMDIENQICVRVKFIRENKSVCTFMNNIYH